MTMNLSTSEAKLIEIIRLLPEHDARDVVDYATFKATRVEAANPARESFAAAMERMANDPEMLREMRAIEEEFRPALNDGLEKY